MELPLVECHVDFDELLNMVGISEAELSRRDGQVSLRKYLNFMEQAACLAGDPLTGIRLARSCGPETLGALGFLFLSSQSLAIALSDFCIYVNLLQDRLVTRFIQTRDELVFHYDIYGLAGADSKQDVEFSLALNTRLIRMFVGSSGVVERINFRHSASAPPAAYERMLGTRVRFDQEANSLVMPAAIASAPSHALDASLSAILKDYLDQALERERGIQSYADEVRRIILSNRIPAPVTAAKMADYLKVSPATLYRKLRAEGATFGKLFGEVSFDLAGSYLTDSSLSITQIAHIIGFAEAASFTRAFSRWSGGITPSRFRRGAR